jgi:glycosyltransferase involved in cell wall biosynthesis
VRFAGRSFSLRKSVRSWQAVRAAAAPLRKIISEFKPDAVMSCTNRDHFCAGTACRPLRVPSIWWVNDIISADFFSWPVRAAFVRKARATARRLVAVSEYARRALLREGVPASKVVTIHNGVPLGRYQRAARGHLREPLGLPMNAPLVGILGRFTPWKGQEFFLELAREWIRTRPEGHFLLIGQAFNDEQDFEQHLRRAAACSPGGRIHFVPFQENVVATLSDLDVLVHASTRPEPFGRVLIEAMAVGVPVLAARAGGVPEIMNDDVEGLLATPGNLGEYRTQLEHLLGDAAFARSLADAAQRAVKRRFTIERVRGQFEQLLAEVG